MNWIKTQLFSYSKLDILFLIVIASFLIQDVFIIISHITEILYDYLYNLNIVQNMSNNGVTSSTNTTIVHSNDGWAQGIKSIFVYGSGALRLQLLRSGGTPMQRTFVISSTLAVDAASTALKNAINDPEYVEKHFNNWTRTFSSKPGEIYLYVTKDVETLQTLNNIPTKIMYDHQILDTVVG